MWTCINLWIMITLNDKLYKISQRFYYCGSKVVLNRLLSDLCDPRLCSRAAGITCCTMSHFIWDSAFWEDPILGFKVRYGARLLSDEIKCDSCYLEAFWGTVPDKMTPWSCLAAFGEGVYRRRKHQGHVNKTACYSYFAILLIVYVI